MSEAIVLNGKIRKYRVERGSANFYFTDTEQKALGMAAIGAALVGASGVAMGTAISASDIKEEADQVEFEIDGICVSGWVWRSPFSEGDEVTVVAERDGESYSIAAIVRPQDRMIAMYPHLSRGRLAHFLNAVKWWLLGSSGVAMFGIIVLSIGVLIGGENPVSYENINAILWTIAIIFPLLLLPAIHMTFKHLRFVRAAETIFRKLDWNNVGRIDLPKSSKGQKHDIDDPEYGIYYFRY